MIQMSMDIQNPIIKQELTKTISTYLTGQFTCHDYDGARYCIEYKNEDNSVYFSFGALNFQSIFQIAGDHLINKYYSGYEVQKKPYQGYDLTFRISLDVIQTYTKQTSDEEKKKIKQNNEETIQKISSDFAKLRTNFYSSPFEKIFDQVKKDDKSEQNFSYQIRSNERVWCLKDSDQISVYFALTFTDIVDRTIAQLMLDEFVESNRHVKNPPSVLRVEKILDQQQRNSMIQNEYTNSISRLGGNNSNIQSYTYPQNLIDKFPELKNVKEEYVNGLISFTFFKKTHIFGDTDTICNYLANFRQYVHYHVHASKTYLHGRLLKNIAKNLKDLSFTKFEQEEEKNYRTQRDEIINSKAMQQESQQARNIIRK